MLLKLTGLGSLRPNTLVIGYHEKWRKSRDSQVKEYVDVLKDALRMGNGVIITVGLRRINWVANETYVPPPFSWTSATESVDNLNDSGNNEDSSDNENDDNKTEKTEKTEHTDASTLAQMQQTRLERSMSAEARIHLDTQKFVDESGKKPYIDVWWLIDDGGLLMLIPYVLKQHTFWKNCRFCYFFFILY